MKKIPTKRRKERGACLGLSGRAVERVANDRMTKGGEVDADLMRASGVQIGFEECVTRQAHADAPVRSRRAALPPPRGHADAAMQIARDGQLDAACVAFQPAMQ